MFFVKYCCKFSTSKSNFPAEGRKQVQCFGGQRKRELLGFLGRPNPVPGLLVGKLGGHMGNALLAEAQGGRPGESAVAFVSLVK